MGVMVDQNGKPMSGWNSSNNSGFNGTLSDGTSLTTGYNFPESKYYDIYNFLEENVGYVNRILGDATGEMGPFGYATYLIEKMEIEIGSWYDDVGQDFVKISSPYFIRGSARRDGTMAGVFGFSSTSGAMHGSFRLILTPTGGTT